MDPERWIRIKNLFQRVIELPASDQSAFLERECPDDDDLKSLVVQMIEADRLAESFLENPPTVLSRVGGSVFISEERIGTTVGGYTITGKLGEGGMGTVYLARATDETFQRVVAVKIVKHVLDTQTILERFYNERQILAALDHPNIARLIDGGITGDGLPYFIMEYVDGKTITEYCDQKQATLSERLHLFAKVCEAVQYAHNKLIVHRDIKPSNVLVTADGVVKLLDFGIAKMLTRDESIEALTVTSVTFPVMTPEYASPEQIKGERVTTASDVYSLGVFLYELLCGFRPYDIKTRTPAEIERTIMNAQPVKPSTLVITRKSDTLEIQRICDSRSTTVDRLRRNLSGDLDNIIMTALRKEQTRRYQSAEQLLNDIERYNNSLPVSARPDTLSYRASKFVRRHTYGVVTALFVFLILLAGIVTTAWQARRATEAKHQADEQRVLAERRFNEVRELARRFMFDFHSEIEHLSGSRKARELLVSTALEYLERLANDAGEDRELLSELASAYVRVGDIQGNPYVANLGNTAAALDSYLKAEEILEKLAVIAPENINYLRSQAHTINKIGDLQQWSGNTEDAKESFMHAKRILTDISEIEPDNKTTQRETAASLVKIGDLYSWHGHDEEALPYYGGALEIVEKLAFDDPGNIQAIINLSVGHSKVGYTLSRLGELDSALIHHRTALDITIKYSEQFPDNATLRRSVAINANQVGSVYMAMDQPGSALREFYVALNIVLKLHEADPGNPLSASDITYTRNKIGEALIELKDFQGALEEFKAACTIREHLADKDPMNQGFQRDLAVSMSMVGQTYLTIAENNHRLEDWYNTKDWLDRSLQIITQMQERGTLRDGDRNRPNELNELIERCNKNIQLLEGDKSP
jgi:eukaryotic-like serine/threonine-protein kinase